MGRQLRKVRPPLTYGVKVQRQGGLVGDLPDRIPLGIPERHDVVRVGDFETAHTTTLDHTLHLFHCSFNGGVGDARKSGVTIRVCVAEVGELRIVNAYQLDGGLSVVQPPGGAEDPVEHFSLDAVALLVLQPQLWISEPSDAALAVVVKTSGGHAVGAVDFARDVLASG